MIRFQPKRGQILACNFSEGFRVPEVTKVRPVIVLASRAGPWLPDLRFAGPLVTVVALSTKAPKPPTSSHFLLPRNHLPQIGYFQTSDSWVKGDLVYAVSFRRLDLYQLGKHQKYAAKRAYYGEALPAEILREVHSCVLHSLSIGHVAQYL